MCGPESYVFEGHFKNDIQLGRYGQSCDLICKTQNGASLMSDYYESHQTETSDD